jgi:quercetin dioxygenase-like cupin family protein
MTLVMRKLACLSLVFAFALGCSKSDDNKKPKDEPPTPTPKPEIEPEPEPAPDPTGGYSLTAPADLEYGKLDPNNPEGPDIAVVHGNPQDDEMSAVFLRVPAKGDAGVHTHTVGYHAVVVSGSPKHWLPGEKKVKSLSPGDYWYQPGGQAHGDSCDGPDPCVLFILFEGKFDFAPAPDVKKVETGDYKLVRAKDAKWGPLDPKDKKGKQIAMLNGDPATGPVAFGLQVPGGGEAGLHSHTSDYHAVVLAGTPSHWIEGGEGENDELGAGTYWFQPGAQVHGDTCRGKDACSLFVFMPEKLDMIPKAAGGDEDGAEGDEGDEGEGEEG